jgi:TetR/AcrR family transcriptional repressor of nem operon
MYAEQNEMTKTQKQIQGEQTRQRIIEEAAKLFVRKGFHGTSIADLAQAAGLTKGALYHHFDGKDDLFYAVVEMVRDAWTAAVVRDVLKEANALDRLGVLLDNHVRMVSENQMLCLTMASLVADMDDGDPAFADALVDVYSDLVYFIQRIVQKGQDAGEVRTDLSARLVAFNIVGMLRTSCCRILQRLEPDYAVRMETLKHMILAGLRP